MLAMLLAVAIGAPGTLVGDAVAQASSCQVALHCVSADEALRRFTEEAIAQRSDFGHAAVLFILTNPNVVPASRRDSVASGLEALILTSDVNTIRAEGAMFLTAAGSREFPTPLPDASQRVARVYQRTPDPSVRAHILETIFQLPDRQVLIPLLREVATRPQARPVSPFDHDPDDPERAIVALAQMGEEGRTVLRELHRTNVVRSARAAGALERLARRGYSLEKR